MACWRNSISAPGCLASVAQDGCGAARALEGASSIVVSPDNLHVYVAASTAAAVTSFARQPNGSLVQLAGVAGCISTSTVAGCSGATSLGGADAIAISPDGHFVYVAGGTADSLLMFSRDAATGRLTQLAGTAGCLRNGRSDCGPVTGIDAPAAIAISPDGTSLYVASSAGTLTAFAARSDDGSADAAGARSRLPERRGLRGLHGRRRPGARVRRGHHARRAHRDRRRHRRRRGRSFRRDPASGASRAPRACPPPPPRRAAPPGPDRRPARPGRAIQRADVWVAASRADSIVHVADRPDHRRADCERGPGGCLRRLASSDAARRGRSTTRAGSSASADGSHVYAVSAQSDGIAVLGPQLAPNCLHVRRRPWPTRLTRSCSRARSQRRQDHAADRPPAQARPPERPRQGDREQDATRPSPATSGADSFTYTRDGWPGRQRARHGHGQRDAAARAPAVRIRTERRDLPKAGASTCSSSARRARRRLPCRRAPAGQGRARAMASRASSLARPAALVLRANGVQAPHQGPESWSRRRQVRVWRHDRRSARS